MILATDMFKHFEHYTKFVTVFNKPAEDTTGAETKVKSGRYRNYHKYTTLTDEQKK